MGRGAAMMSNERRLMFYVDVAGSEAKLAHLFMPRMLAMYRPWHESFTSRIHRRRVR